MPKIKAKRLLKLADKLKTVPDANFNMGQWFGDDTTSLGATLPDPIMCGTAACALGWATTIPEFHRAGLGLFRSYGSFVPCLFSMKGDGYPVVARGLEAGQVFFGLTYEQANDLFGIEKDVGKTAKEMAAKIRRLVKKASKK